jgi:hypothetical protein
MCLWVGVCDVFVYVCVYPLIQEYFNGEHNDHNDVIKDYDSAASE